MHILILPSWYPSRKDPINGSFFAEQAVALSRSGHRVSVIAFYGDAQKGCNTEENWREDVTEYALHFRPLPFHLTALRLTRALLELFGSVFGEDRPDILHVHSFRMIRYARLLHRLYHIPYVVTEHVSWFERGMLSEKDKRAIAADYKGASAMIAVSRGLKEQIQPLCRQEVRVVPNLVSERFFLSPPEKKPSPVFRFLSVGSLNRNKGMDMVISAFAQTQSTHPNAVLTICGDGEERASLEQLAASLGLTDKVFFSGWVSREQCAQHMSACDVFVLASRVETFGIVLAEAMASARPIVMTKTGAWRELCVPETGIAVETDNVNALSEAMSAMIDNIGAYDPERIRAFCRERFSEKAVCDELTRIYNDVLGK